MTTYVPGSRGRCPHCLTTVKFLKGKQEALNYMHADERLWMTIALCPECGRLIVTLETGEYLPGPGKEFAAEKEFVVWPRESSRPVPKEVPGHIAADYKEAAEVLNISPKASAALSRRCLQAVLREAANANQHNLADQIKAVKPNLPSYIADNVDAIRQIGNFAAHPIKERASEQIVDVEPGEAEWNLEVLDLLFDFYYVHPTLARQKRDALNAKLKAAGKRPMK